MNIALIVCFYHYLLPFFTRISTAFLYLVCFFTRYVMNYLSSPSSVDAHTIEVIPQEEFSFAGLRCYFFVHMILYKRRMAPARRSLTKLRSHSLRRRLVPGVGIEPTTLSSSGLRSTTELPRQLRIKIRYHVWYIFHQICQIICHFNCTYLLDLLSSD